MSEKRYSPLAASLNALGANSLVSHMLTAVRDYPPCRKMDNAQISDLINAFNDQQLLQMATLVLANAQHANAKALRQARMNANTTGSPKAAARQTTEVVKAGLIIRAQRFLEKGAATNPPATARCVRHLTQLWYRNTI